MSFALALLVWIPAAFAQDPAAPAEATQAETQEPETLYTTGEVGLLRFPGAAGGDNPVVKSVAADTAVTVVYREGELVRVRSGADFGWAQASMLTDEAPAPVGGGLLDGLDLGGIGGGLGGNPFGGSPFGSPTGGLPGAPTTPPAE